MLNNQVFKPFLLAALLNVFNYNIMSKYLYTFTALLTITLIFSCSTKNKSLNAIEKLEKELYSKPELDKKLAAQLIDTYVAYADLNKSDTNSAMYLFKAAELAMNTLAGSQSVLYFDKIINNFPSYSRAADCVFLKAFVYENQLGNLDEAKKYYNEFITKYPNHILVKDAKASLQFLGMSPEELIKHFETVNNQ